MSEDRFPFVFPEIWGRVLKAIRQGLGHRRVNRLDVERGASDGSQERLLLENDPCSGRTCGAIEEIHYERAQRCGSASPCSGSEVQPIVPGALLPGSSLQLPKRVYLWRGPTVPKVLRGGENIAAEVE